MIRLTLLNTHTEPEVYLFNKSVILIGSALSEVDLHLPEADLQSIHLKIVEQNGFIILINIANDPFVSINGHPFGKKLLNNGDVILIHDREILFESPKDSPIKEKNLESEKSLVEVSLPNKSSHILTETSLSVLPQIEAPFLVDIPFEKEVGLLHQEEWSSSAIDQYLKEIEKDPKITQSSHPNKLPANSYKQRVPVKSLKDDYLKDLDDDNSEQVKATDVNHLYQAWKWIIFFIFSLISLVIIAGAIVYLTVSDKTEAQETKAAQGVADIAMALTHARMNHLKPHNQNWSDAEFLKANLQAILPNIHSHASEIDSQGQFTHFPYSIRVYTNSDLTRFLLIAQPAPSLLQWLIPKSIILVDSNNMELRTVKDIRNLNRLLTDSDPLEGVNHKEISAFVKQGQLIQLSALAADSGHIDFIPPKNLGWLQPGSENLIYNAPRYYRLGQSLIQKATALSTSKGTSQEVTLLKQDVETFSLLNNLILYTDQGKKHAALVRQGLKTFAPSDKILYGYLTLNAKGKIDQAYLLKEDEEELKDLSTNLIAMRDEPTAPIIEETPLTGETALVDTNHPIYIQLSVLARAREIELKPLLAAVLQLLENESRAPHPNFQTEFQKLTAQYLLANTKHKRLIRESLSLLYEQYEEMPIDRFISFLQGVGFEYLIQQNAENFNIVEEDCIQNVESMLPQIEKANSFVELDNLIHISCSWLTFDYIKEPDELIKYQNQIRNRVLQQLENLLLSSNKHLPSKQLDIEEQEAIRRILSYEKIIKLEEQEFFLEELHDLLKNEQEETHVS